jgi:HD superfamily phosphohydrolase YqeK
MAPFLLKRDFKIKERDVLNCTGMHTTCSLKMSIMDKILYIADKIEETRDYEGVEKLRHLSLEDINLCLLEVYKSNIIYVIKGNKVLHPDTAKIWNYIHGGLRHAT